jgi:hypothetical protein
VGDPDLSPDTPPLAGLIRAGDPGAIAGFRDARLPRVQAYVAQVCPPELAEDAVSAAFMDFFARLATTPEADAELDRLLLAATRSAAAGRFTVASPPGHTLAVSIECQAMPELLAVHANRERPTDEALIGEHLAGCSICAHTLVRMQDAERAFAQPFGELPAMALQETVVDTAAVPPPRPAPPTPPRPAPPTPPRPSSPTPPRAASPRPASPLRPAPSPESGLAASSAEKHDTQPKLEPDSRPYPPPAANRRRSGGLVGAIRRFSRTIRT